MLLGKQPKLSFEIFVIRIFFCLIFVLITFVVVYLDVELSVCVSIVLLELGFSLIEFRWFI